MTVQARRRALTRKAERARGRQARRAAVAWLRRAYGPGYDLLPAGWQARGLLPKRAPVDYWPRLTPEQRAAVEAAADRALARGLAVEQTERRQEGAALAAAWRLLALASVRLFAVVRVLVAAALARVTGGRVRWDRPRGVVAWMGACLDHAGAPQAVTLSPAGGAAMPP